MLTYITFRNNYCFNVSMLFNTNRRQGSAANAFWERVWWLQMMLYMAWGTNSNTSNRSAFEGPLRGGETEK